MKSNNIHEAKTHLSRLVGTASRPVKTGGLRIPGGVPDDFDTMFAEEIETLFSASTKRAAKGRTRR